MPGIAGYESNPEDICPGCGGGSNEQPAAAQEKKNLASQLRDEANRIKIDKELDERLRNSIRETKVNLLRARMIKEIPGFIEKLGTSIKDAIRINADESDHAFSISAEDDMYCVLSELIDALKEDGFRVRYREETRDNETGQVFGGHPVATIKVWW